MNSKRMDLRIFLILTMIAYIFSLSVRYIWINEFKNVEQFKWNNELMINTNDGYYYAEGARDIIADISQENDNSPISSPLAKLTALLTNTLPFSIETVILWMPAVFGSFLVIPIMLIARSLNQEYMGFVAALFGGIVWSYYNRTMIGYYDTDMLVIVLPTLVLWTLVLNLHERKDYYLILVPFFVIAYAWWYPQSYALNMAMAFMVFVYICVWERERVSSYMVLLFMLISLVNTFWWLKILLSLVLLITYHFKRELFSKQILLTLFILACLWIFITDGFAPILNHIKNYIFRGAYAADILDNLNLHYFAVSKTVREAGQIPFEVFANRISGHTVTFIFSAIGYILLSLKYRIMWLALPMVALGFLALKGGLRFTVYAVPFMALGVSYLIFFIAEYISNLVQEHLKRVTKISFVTLSTIAILSPNVKHVHEYKVPTVFNKGEVQVLSELQKIAGREDYVATWWDYGFPIRYYSDVKTLIDGAQHSGQSNFLVSFALINNQVSGANMSRLAVEYLERQFEEKFDSRLIQMMKDYKSKSVMDFLDSLFSKEFKLPNKTRDIYMYLPDRMMNILSTIQLFSNLDLMTGKQFQNNFFFRTKRFHDDGKIIKLSKGVSIIKNTNEVQIGNQNYKINHFAVTKYNQQGKLTKKINKLSSDGKLNVIYMTDYKRFIVLDNKMFDSTYIQLYVLENYDKDLYEPVIMSPFAKVYKLKR